MTFRYLLNGMRSNYHEPSMLALKLQTGPIVSGKLGNGAFMQRLAYPPVRIPFWKRRFNWIILYSKYQTICFGQFIWLKFVQRVSKQKFYLISRVTYILYFALFNWIFSSILCRCKFFEKMTKFLLLGFTGFTGKWLLHQEIFANGPRNFDSLMHVRDKDQDCCG